MYVVPDYILTEKNGMYFLKYSQNYFVRFSDFSYRASVAFLTYVAYMFYHMSRRPISVVKSVFHRNCSDLTPPTSDEPSNWCEWAPFGKSN